MSLDHSIDALVGRARSGDRRALGRLVSLVEAGDDGANQVLGAVYDFATQAVRIGITGAPGAGKSTLSSGLIAAFRRRQASVAVLAVDPSSPFSGGAILGDRIRMQHHIEDSQVYIRSVASRGSLGGLSAAVGPVMALLEGIGFDVVIIETVGVGQAEVDVAGQADTTVVVVTPGWGDSVQANKAGVLEIGDVFVVNKSDRDGADAAVRDLETMLDLGEQVAGIAEWRPPIIRTVATEETGVEDLVAALDAHRDVCDVSTLRVRRARSAFHDAVRRRLIERIDDLDALAPVLADVLDGTTDPWTAASVVVEALDVTATDRALKRPS